MYLFIAGSTGTGKTKLAQNLKREFMQQNKKVKLISCDSVQIYKNLNIGSNKDTEDHVGINLLEITEGPFDVVQYVAYVHTILKEEDIDLFIITGGTLFYMQRLLDSLLATSVDKILGVIYLERDRVQQYRETDLRCEKMVLGGLLLECSCLHKSLTSLLSNVMDSIGYRNGKELVTFLRKHLLSNNLYLQYLTPLLEKKFEKYKNFFMTKQFIDSSEFQEIQQKRQGSINLFKDVKDESLNILITEFEKFLKDFQKRTRNYVRKQNSFFNTFHVKYSSRIPVRILNTDYSNVCSLKRDEHRNLKTHMSTERLINEVILFISTISCSSHNPSKNNFKALKTYKPNTVLLKDDTLEELLSELILFQFYLNKKMF